ncbi:toxin VasX [Burkholderia sp. S171]|uniref:toxin VasX n=1 Tax=Burkholderia sp. S171 TaxID=1641860 RepID=UPI00349E7115
MPELTQFGNSAKASLPILPVRYAVLPKRVSVSMHEGVGSEGVTQIGLTQHNYGLHTLRVGCLYLFYVKGARGNLVVAVTSSGPLIQRLAGHKGYVLFPEKLPTFTKSIKTRNGAGKCRRPG